MAAVEITTGTKRLRVTTSGSVDDGKSTLIGRLLYDSKSLFDDHLDALERVRTTTGSDGVDLALLTDGLRAEREQGITIDVAYRYFATPARSFVLADVPGHEQYTANMVTGASVSEVALVLVDARKGVLDQTRRHLAVAALLRLPAIVVVVNKMDLVGWDKDTFATLADDARAVVAGLGVDPQVHVVPVSALNGDNVVEPSVNTPWYDGPPLLDLLERLDVDGHATSAAGARLAVQSVLRTPDGRALTGQLAGGPLAVGDQVLVLPSGVGARVAGLSAAGRPAECAVPGQAIAVILDRDLDAGRGDVVCGTATAAPSLTTTLRADVCWLADTPATSGSAWLLKLGTRTVRVRIDSIDHALDVTTLGLLPERADLRRNDVGQVTITAASPLAADLFTQCQATGRFVLIEPHTNGTAAAGIVIDLS